MKLNNKTVLITGGTSGVGLELVRQLEGYNCILVIARAGARLDNLKREFPALHTYAADLGNPDIYPALCQRIVDEHPQIDLLINNAAVQYTPTFLDDDFDYRSIAREITLNFTAICALTHWLLPALLHSNQLSRIVNINSGLALAPKTQSAIYCATKAALASFSQSLGYQLENTNVRVLQAFLPLTDTPMTTGRGTVKLSAQQAAAAIIGGIKQDKTSNHIGKVRLLRVLLAILPPLARKIMKGH
ncbi:SDR family oxidoreductase [Lacimicrobium alkaliphilum]|uniref:Short-chain dehydrogenase n=1 Tax=Lacimicrobium alkaliphilum TaxID=1526571 RepID=A0A0U3AGZ7_9ALTE|nr:SDR family NAD(P)-dependent oxidoreductase [Lacimicrobium alkaliphilum]ALT00319.1 hypothetical protein AT746_04265 [Lacimicrobium alkaliphilum]